MSDQPQGEDWWEASDDKWYPPEKHPDYLDPRPPPPPDDPPPASDPPPAPESKARPPGWESAEWMIEAVQDEGIASGRPLIMTELMMLSRDVRSYLGTQPEPLVIELNNKVVTLARSAMKRAKRQGAPTVKARRGHTIPVDWFNHYSVLYDEDCPLVIAVMMQNAMLNNPVAGELKPWKSR